MRGQFPPCTACSNAMRQFARNENCEITYEYPTDRKMKYSPKESGPSPEPVSNQAELKDLCDSYQSRTRTPKKKEQEGSVERARLGYQTSATSTNVATKDRKGNSEENYEKAALVGGTNVAAFLSSLTVENNMSASAQWNVAPAFRSGRPSRSPGPRRATAPFLVTEVRGFLPCRLVYLTLVRWRG